MNIIEELEWRGLIADCTDHTGLSGRLNQGPATLYAGFDPTADSLHAGSLVPLIALRRFQLKGHRPIALAGGATGAIGDPSGKSAERNLLTSERIQHNIESVKEQLKRLLDFEAASNPALLVDNNSWTEGVSFIQFLRDYGKHFTVNKMVAKESVRARMEDRETGISYTEFSYMLLQAFDFYHLCKTKDCLLQIGGSDQWGNITAGIELCHKKLRRQTFGLTLPLIAKADGTKFGKTESGTVWLDARKTSVYKFYQFWVRADDRDAVKFLKYFTMLEQKEVEALKAAHEENPGKREAHKALAWEMTRMIHGETATDEAVRASEVLFGGGLDNISEATFQDIAGEAPSVSLPMGKFEGEGILLNELFAESGLCASKGQARKDIQGGGANVNNIRQTQWDRRIRREDLLFGKHLLLRKGKKHYVVVTAEESPSA